MAESSIVNVVEHCKILPPPHSAPPTTLALTFLDIPWLFFSPSKPLFFFEYPHSFSHFLSTTLPKLKHSLSLALQHYFTFSGTLVLFPNNIPNIVYTEGDYVSFTVAQSSGDFSHFTSYNARGVNGFYNLVPKLPTSSTSAIGTQAELPLFAAQVTVFSNSGICIGLAYHHVVADGRTFNNFIKAWASFCADPSFGFTSLPSYDRSAITDPNGLEKIFLKELWKRKLCYSSQEMVIGTETQVDLLNMVRATFVMSSIDMERIKQWIIAQCNKKNQPQPVHLSPYVLTCAFVWACLVKTQSQRDQSEIHQYFGEDPIHFGFVAGGMTRLGFSVSPTYAGNCVGFGLCTAIRNELMGEDGIIVAANVIGNTIKKLDKEIFYGAENWISDWKVLFGSEVHVMVCGSPKVDLYETNFGWGRPRKIEDIAIDRMRAISLAESRDLKGGIEIGLALPNSQMDAFRSLFTKTLKILQ